MDSVSRAKLWDEAGGNDNSKVFAEYKRSLRPALRTGFNCGCASSFNIVQDAAQEAPFSLFSFSI